MGVVGVIVFIKNEEYIVGDDELIILDDFKGDIKIDVVGCFLGDWEYKFVIFILVEWWNFECIYVFIIDVVWVCGYLDFLVFFRCYFMVFKLLCIVGEWVKLIDFGWILGNLKYW